jgi:putative nucleotidyltransferase with HDIG domain
VVSEQMPPRRPVLTLDDLARPATRRPERLHALTAADLAVGFSLALDLAEGKPLGHARRVCYIATTLADALGLEAEARSGVYFGALLHDIGVTPAGAGLCRAAGIDEEAIFGPLPARQRQDGHDRAFDDHSAVVDATRRHTALGADLVRELELPEEAARAVMAHHEEWSGSGYPEGSAGHEIPVEARIVAAADLAEVLIAGQVNALVARRHFPALLRDYAAVQLEPRVVGALLEVARDDGFWLGLYAEDIAETLLAMRGAVDTRRSRRRVMRFAEVFADLSDAKGADAVGHSRRTADGAERLAQAVQLDEGHAEMVRIAALLHDIGLLGVPARIMSKPDILSVTEMQVMRQHPAHSETVLESLPGFEEVALWVARHHERPDGKGYPEMLDGDEIPLESRIIAVADVYAALVAERPHRGALSRKDAKRVLLGMAGTQLDPELVRTFVTLV